MGAHPFLACVTPSRRDLAVAASLPVVAVPPDGGFEPLVASGRRLVVSRGGMLIEAKSPVLHVLLPIMAGEVPAYGGVAPFVRLPAPIPLSILDDLGRFSREACPNEMAALVVARDRGYHVLRPESSAHRASVTYDDTGHTEGELVLDVHSHGRFVPVFSSTDDASDMGRSGPHISIVFGECAEDQTMWFSARACIGACLIDLDPMTIRDLFA